MQGEAPRLYSWCCLLTSDTIQTNLITKITVTKDPKEHVGEIKITLYKLTNLSYTLFSFTCLWMGL